MVNYKIIVLDDIQKTFSVIGHGDKYKYSFGYKSKFESSRNVQIGDKVLGYVDDPYNSFCYLFTICQVDSNYSLTMIKEFECEKGLSIDQVEEPLNNILNSTKNESKIIDISKAQFDSILSKMLKTINPKSETVLKEKIQIKYETGYKSPYEYNRIIFGAPGTGKSYNLNKDRMKLLQNGGAYERVTFYPDYMHSQFIGSYRPVTDESGTVQYNYVPGPFMRALVEAYKRGSVSPAEPVVLIIEEINRANAAAVFGELFQLLDRNPITNVSEFEVHIGKEVSKYLADELGGNPSEYTFIKIPDNMFIWATMNSADQGVFPLDTAFKRRWSFTYLDINAGQGSMLSGKFRVGDSVISWNGLRRAINAKLSDEKINVREDKLLGPFFLNVQALKLKEGFFEDNDTFIKMFENKVLMYLFEDVTKTKNRILFEGCSGNVTRFSTVCREFEEKGLAIFGSEFETKYYNSEL